MTAKFFGRQEPITFRGEKALGKKGDDFAFRWYDPDRKVMGKRMEDQLRFAVCYWHSFTWPGTDPFGGETFQRPWMHMADPMEAARAKEAEEKAQEAPSAFNVSAEDLAAFAGTYASRILGDATVSVAASALRLKLEETDATLLLTPRDDDVFDARLEGTGAFAPLVAMEGDGVLTQIRFERGADGAVTGLRWTSPALPQVFARQP